MTKAIASYPVFERSKVIERRLSGSQRGLGYWAAFDARKKIKEKLEKAQSQ